MIDTFECDSLQWASEVFATSTLPDERLNDRLVVYAAAQATDPQASTSASARGDRAAREGAYRFLENPRVNPVDIEQGHFDYTAEQCSVSKRVLLIQDTSSVSVASPELRTKLIASGNPTGFLAHSTLAVDAKSGVVKGLIDQQRWIRERKAEHGKKNLRRREIGLKESAKWAVSDMAARTRLHEHTQVVTVCDREADGYEIFLHHVDKKWLRLPEWCTSRGAA